MPLNTRRPCTGRLPPLGFLGRTGISRRTNSQTSSGTLRNSPFMPTTIHTDLGPPANFPHVLGARSYLVASPMGLIPCPTISLVIGVSLLLGGFESPRWTAAVAIVGLFY